MNTGIQDAISLGAALTETLADGQDARLDTWAHARHAVAQDVVAMTDRMTRMGTLQSAVGKTLRNAALSLAGHVPAVRRAIATNLAELHVR
jgi:2-polyprenyl-6-methoxyphenol hydroxylase-like FAD-dependent oxidoreductase